ncbi:MAG TPA: hypothetical protein VHD32_02280 [Candidatus Didemnitutus sp.]|nr:hypothetical protein [Candidatus Didemnitutus sp.]
MLENNHRPKVTIEDLLHLKRAERPASEFWSKFEGELRQKQLAALLEKRPWWHMPAMMARRAMIPVGAALAVGAVALISRHDFSSAPSTSPVRTTASVRHLPEARVATTEKAPAPIAAAAGAESVPVVQRTVAALSEKFPDGASELTPWSAPRPQDTPSSRSIAASLARVEATEPDLANASMGDSLPMANTRLAATSSPATVELASVSAVVSRRSHLLAQLDDRRFTPEPQAPELVRERLARRLADTDFNDSFSRVGLERGGVSVKF